MKVQKFKRGQIWWYETGTNYNGSLPGKTRPVILVSNDAANAFSNCLIGVPCTSQEKKDLPTHITTLIDGTYSTIMAENVMSVNANRLTGYIGVVDDELMTRIEDILLVALGLKEIEKKEYVETKSTLKSTIDILNDIPIIDATTDTNAEKTTDSIMEPLADTNNTDSKTSTATLTVRRGRPAPTKDDMIRFIDDYENHDIDYMMKKYNVANKNAAALRATRYRKKLAEVS